MVPLPPATYAVARIACAADSATLEKPKRLPPPPALVLTEYCLEPVLFASAKNFQIEFCAALFEIEIEPPMRRADFGTPVEVKDVLPGVLLLVLELTKVNSAIVHLLSCTENAANWPAIALTGTTARRPVIV